MPGPVHHAPCLHLEVDDADSFARADIVFEGVDQSGPSFEARVYLDNPGADATTGKSADEGYAGAFHVYGEGRPAGPPAPTTRYLTATEAVRRALRNGPDIAVSVVAVAYGPAAPRPAIDLHIERVSIVIDRPPA